LSSSAQFVAPPVARGPAWIRALTPFATAAIVLVFGVVAYVGSRREADSTALVERTHEMIDGNQGLLARVVDAESGERGYIITGDPRYLAPYEGVAPAARLILTRLRVLADDDPAQLARVDTLGSLVEKRLAALTARVEARRTQAGPVPRNVLAVGIGEATMDSIRALAKRMEISEDRLLEQRHANAAAHARSVLVIITVGTAAAITMALALNLMLGRYAASQERLARQLEEQNNMLEAQSDALEASGRLLEDHALELEETQTLLLQRTREAEDANRAKCDFLARMSHELRTPLNAIVGYADLLELGLRGPVTADQLTDLARMKRSGRHLMGLIDNVLNFSKLESGGLTLDVEPLRLRDVITEVEPFVAPQMEAKGIQLCLANCPVDLVVMADRAKLDQMLINLLTNAYKFTPAGGKVDIDCERTDRGVSISISDTGRGIAADELETIFQPFVQVGQPARESTGVGLGLAITKDLAEAMGGTLRATSTVGVGSTFTLTLPAPKC
jgi:signal transduction histidine kinase